MESSLTTLKELNKFKREQKISLLESINSLILLGKNSRMLILFLHQFKINSLKDQKLMFKKLIGEKRKLFLMLKIKDNAVLVGLFQQLDLWKLFLQLKPENLLNYQNKNLLIVHKNKEIWVVMED